MIAFDISNSSDGIKDKLITCLKTVIDPELFINIVDLGLVYAVKFDGKKMLISVQMTLSSKFCPMGDSIIIATKNSLERDFNNFKAEVNVVWEPEWNYKFISPEGLKILGE
ncbi:MAG: metal-sulfur cluster assembly factor [Pedobacter sp.]|nr:metal-sulfur cluster assembly factor [Pedobacter sp.]